MECTGGRTRSLAWSPAGAPSPRKSRQQDPGSPHQRLRYARLCKPLLALTVSPSHRHSRLPPPPTSKRDPAIPSFARNRFASSPSCTGHEIKLRGASESTVTLLRGESAKHGDSCERVRDGWVGDAKGHRVRITAGWARTPAEGDPSIRQVPPYGLLLGQTLTDFP